MITALHIDQENFAHPARPRERASLVVPEHRSSTSPNSSNSECSEASSLKECEAPTGSCSENCAATNDDGVWIHPAAVVAAYPRHVVLIFALEDVVGETFCCHWTALVPSFSIGILLAPVAKALGHMLPLVLKAAMNNPISAG